LELSQAELAKLQQASDALSVTETYEVTQRVEKDGDVVVELTYMGDEDPPNKAN